MKIPKKLKVSGKTHQITLVDRKKTGNSDPGGIFYSDLTIWINTDQAQEQQEEALFHETIEIINDEYDLELSHQTITTLASAIYQVLKDNKLLK